ncbi:MAG: DUF5686 and carboxypeptidase regulatory-like domain-containing protein, partial [Bacteroidales bacterium]|nr:DUF5686 and carboxypeptidase regulatory-like domain-containing protein [Bacteroidales bacterium]
MKRFCLLILSLLLPGLCVLGQTRVRGTVTDAQTGEPLPYVSVIFPGPRTGTMTDPEGAFSLESPHGYASVSFQMLGYETLIVSVKPGAATSDLKVKLNPDTYGIQAVVVKPKRGRDNAYRRRGNPAVELVEKVIAHKADNNVKSTDGYHVENYEKFLMSLDKFDVDFRHDRLWRDFAFLEQYVDTSQFRGTPVLNIALRESHSDTWFQKRPRRTRTYVDKRSRLGLQATIDASPLGENVQAIFVDADIYDDDMEVMLNRFVSPLSSSLATSFYKYYISDTLQVEGTECIDLTFVPFNSESYGFTGHLYVVNDSTYALKKYSLGIPAHINLNFVNHLAIEESFDRQANGTMASREKNVFARFYLLKGLNEIYAHKTVVHGDYDFTVTHVPDSLLRRTEEVIHSQSHITPPREWWEGRRPRPLSEKELMLDNLYDNIFTVPRLRRIWYTVESLADQFFPTYPVSRMTTPSDREKSKFDIGPVTSMVHYNEQEGLRLRLGGMTTARLDDQNFFNGYVAYGFRDRKVKGNLTYIHSFVPKEKHPFQAFKHNLVLSAGYDLAAPGQSFSLLDRDNIMMSSFSPEPMQYVRRFEARYEREWPSRISLGSTLHFDHITPAGTLAYQRYGADGALSPVDAFNDWSWSTRLQFTPGKPLHTSRLGKESLASFSKDAPVVSLTHTLGYFDNRFPYNKTEFSAQKRFWLSAFGHIDASISTGIIWNRVPLPVLFTPRTNQSFLLHTDAFNLMAPMEFVMDQYAEASLTYYLKGWILNRVPLIKRLKLREVVSFRILTGSLSERNNPVFGSEGLFAFPEGTRMMTTLPYMEYSVGLENILKFIRVDYVRRISYTEGLSEAQKHGFKVS